MSSLPQPLHSQIQALLREYLDEVIKARTTKYLRRWRGKNGKWQYLYPSKSGGKKRSRHEGHETAHNKLLGASSDKHYHAGASFAAGAGKGHYLIDSVDSDGKVTFHLDEDQFGNKGPQQTMTRAEFRAMLRQEHYADFEKAAQAGLDRREQILQECIESGSEKHIERAQKEIQRWKDLHKAYLKDDSQKEIHRARGQLLKQAKAAGLDKDQVKQILGISSLSDKAGEATATAMDNLRLKLEGATPEQVQEILGGSRAQAEPKQEKKKTPQQEAAARRKAVQEKHEQLKQEYKDAKAAVRSGDLSLDDLQQKVDEWQQFAQEYSRGDTLTGAQQGKLRNDARGVQGDFDNLKRSMEKKQRAEAAKKEKKERQKKERQAREQQEAEAKEKRAQQRAEQKKQRDRERRREKKSEQGERFYERYDTPEHREASERETRERIERMERERQESERRYEEETKRGMNWARGDAERAQGINEIQSKIFELNQKIQDASLASDTSAWEAERDQLKEKLKEAEKEREQAFSGGRGSVDGTGPGTAHHGWDDNPQPTANGSRGGLYGDLGVSKHANAEEIKEAYRKRSRETHPDRGGSVEEQQRVNRAYEVLGHEERRAAYNRSGDHKSASKIEIRKALTDVLFDRIDEIVKAIATKYKRRWRGKNGKWRYEYDKPRDGRSNRHAQDHIIAAHRMLGKDEHYHKGASFAAGAGLGHYHIHARDGDRITFSLDEGADAHGNKAGEKKTVSVAEFKQMLRANHKEAFARHAAEGLKRRQELLKKAKDGGSEKHIARAEKEIERWLGLHSEYLPQSKKKKKTPRWSDTPEGRRAYKSHLASLSDKDFQKVWGRRHAMNSRQGAFLRNEEAIRYRLRRAESPADMSNTGLAYELDFWEGQTEDGAFSAERNEAIRRIVSGLEAESEKRAAEAKKKASGAYGELDVDRDATLSEIKAAFRRKMHEYHSDKGGDDEKAKRINAIYEVLSSDKRRAHYDLHGDLDASRKIQKALSAALFDRVYAHVCEVIKGAPASGPPRPGLAKKKAKDGAMRWMKARPDEKKEREPAQAEQAGSKGFLARMADKAKSALGLGPKPEPMAALKAAKSQDAVNDYYTSLKKRKVSSLSNEEHGFVNAIALFTAGNVASVRNPSQYDASKADSNEGIRPTINGFADKTFVANTSQADYAHANKVIAELANRPYGDGPPLLRGIRASGAALKEFTTEGGIVDTYAFSSWSSDAHVAVRFALDPLDGKPAEKSGQHGDKDWHEGECVLMKIEKPARGTDVTGLSRFPTENETVSGGKVRIERVQTVKQEHHGVKRRWHVVTASHVDEGSEVKKAYDGEQVREEESTLHLPMRTITDTEINPYGSAEPDPYVEEDLDLGVLDLFGPAEEPEEADLEGNEA